MKQKLATVRMPFIVKNAKKQKAANFNSKNGLRFKGYPLTN
jgi:hypothetical protein